MNHCSPTQGVHDMYQTCIGAHVLEPGQVYMYLHLGEHVNKTGWTRTDNWVYLYQNLDAHVPKSGYMYMVPNISAQV